VKPDPVAMIGANHAVVSRLLFNLSLTPGLTTMVASMAPKSVSTASMGFDT
jgi:hypothetical protein